MCTLIFNTIPGDNVSLVIWSVIELSCALICASLPALRPLLQRIPDALSSMARSSRADISQLSGSTPGHTPVWIPEELKTGRFKQLPPLPKEAEYDMKIIRNRNASEGSVD